MVGRITEEAAPARTPAAPEKKAATPERKAAALEKAAAPEPKDTAAKEGRRAGRRHEGRRRAFTSPGAAASRGAAPPGAGTARRRRPASAAGDDDAEREPMSQLRRTIAARLVEAQRTAAILTTFNEVDLGELLALRARHRERFKARHGVDLGLVSLFGRAVIHALREVPILNARIDGTDVVKARHVHLGIAVSTPRGLVVPVVRGADGLGLAALEAGHR